ncbi:MAG: DUF126 domain-containing protein [Chloroflexota bacterium]|nr:DUF126 domain-containing protein [Chloroflexota bacterium]
MERLIYPRVTWIVSGDTMGSLLVGREPLSFWGGLDPNTGEVIDRRHPLSGQRLTNRILAIPHGRGSCSASGVLLEAICNGTGPLAIITSRIDPIIGLGAILAEELYGRVVPVAVLGADDFLELRSGDRVTITMSGEMTLSRG